MSAVFSGYTGDWTGDYLVRCVHTLMRNVTFWVLFLMLFLLYFSPLTNLLGMPLEKRSVNFFPNILFS